MTVTWIVDTLMEDFRGSPPGLIHLSDAARDLGHPVVLTKYVPFSTESTIEQLDDPTGLACGYGTIGFLRNLRKKFTQLRPGGFYESERFSVAYAEARYGQYMLNASNRIDECDTFLASEMKFILPDLVKKYGPLFVRPNSVGKMFSGSLVGTHRFPVDNFLDYVGSFTNDREDEPVQVRLPVDILGEYRYVIDRLSNCVIDASQYRYENVHDERHDVHPAAQALVVRFLSEGNGGPDHVFVMDVAVLEDETAKIIEFNNFSNCGLYACDRYKVVEGVSAVVSALDLQGLI